MSIPEPEVQVCLYARKKKRVITGSIGIVANAHGIALIMVLWVMVMLSIIVLNFVNASKWNTVSTRNLKDETISYYLAVSGFNEAVSYLLEDKDLTVDFIDDKGNLWIDRETQPITGIRTTEDGDIEIRIIDEESRININFSHSEKLRKLLQYAGMPQDLIAESIDSLLDWKDPDREHHLSGAEDEYYKNLQNPYTTKNGFFDVPEELLLVRGFAEFFNKDKTSEKTILNLITTFGRGAVNINTVSQEVMELLGLNPFEIEAVLKQRNEEAGGFRFVPQQFTSYGLNAISSNNFRIEVTAKAKRSAIMSKVSGIVTRKMTPHGFRIHTVYWRERAENSRS